MDDQLQVDRDGQRRSGRVVLAVLVLLALATAAGTVEAAGGAGGAAPPPPPPPPAWDPERDRVIRILPDGTRVAEPRTVRPGSESSRPSGPAALAPPRMPGQRLPGQRLPGQGLPGQGLPSGVAPFPQPAVPETLPTDRARPGPPPPGGQDPWLPGAPAPAPPPPGQSPGSSLPPIPGVSDAAPAVPPRSTEAAPTAPPGPGDGAWLPGTEAAAPPPPPTASAPVSPVTSEPTPATNEPPMPAPAGVPSPAPAGEPDPWLVESGSAGAAPPPPPVSPSPAATAAAPNPWDVAEEAPAPVAASPREEAATAPENPWVPEPATPPAGAEVFPPPGAGEAATRPLVPARPDAGTMRFESPAAVRAEEHVRRLLAAPGDRKVQAYPAGIVPRADPTVAAERGHRPVVLLFYDDASRASDLQAAEFLPVLVKFADRMDIVPIDVTNSTSWSPEERKLVRTYYMASVPTTVVLAADRRPLLLKFQRIDGATLEAKLEANLPR